MNNLKFDWGLYAYQPRPEGRMALVGVNFNYDRFSGNQGIEVFIRIIRIHPGRKYTVNPEDHLLRRWALPLKNFSGHLDHDVAVLRERYTEVLEKLDPHVPELAAAYEADQQAGERKLNQLIQTLFGASPKGE